MEPKLSRSESKFSRLAFGQDSVLETAAVPSELREKKRHCVCCVMVSEESKYEVQDINRGNRKEHMERRLLIGLPQAKYSNVVIFRFYTPSITTHPLRDLNLGFH
jgi:hypothetical protein